MSESLHATQPKPPSTGIMASYGIGKFLVEFFTAAFGALVFLYYETNLQLGAGLTALGIIIYSIWNAINDPLVGYLTIKPTRFAKKYGRRYPWIFAGTFLWVFSLVLIFAVPKTFTDDPQANKSLIFLWMVLSTCLYDTLFSVWELNYQSLFPDKFRGEKTRAKAAGIATLIGVFGIAGGSMLPTFILDYESAATFVQNAWIFAIVGFGLSFLFMPGVHEDPEMIKRYLAEWEQPDKSTVKQESFFKQLKKAFKQRNFMAFILLYFLYQATTMSMTGSVHYVGKYVLPGGAQDTTIIFAGLLVGALISLPLWIFIAKKIKSNQKAMIFAALFMILALLPINFMPRTYTNFTITITLFGAAFGGFWYLITPAMADVIDEVVVKTGERKDGVYMGFRAFFGRLSWAVQALSFLIVHKLTGFDETIAIQSDAAVDGIIINMALLPMFFLFIGVIIFWRMNTLTPQKMEEIHAQLDQMQL
jgi:GPH family glycoside/pentoside/hexuronide:cation symporter